MQNQMSNTTSEKGAVSMMRGDVEAEWKRPHMPSHAVPAALYPTRRKNLLLPYNLAGDVQERTSTERKTATFLEPLTINLEGDGSYDPSTYSEYWV